MDPLLLQRATGEPQLRILAAAREGSGGGLRRRGERCFVGLWGKIQNIVGIVPTVRYLESLEMCAPRGAFASICML